MNKTDIKIEKRIPFDYKLAIESEICSCKERIEEIEEKIRNDKKLLEVYKGRISGLQTADCFFDRWRESEKCEVEE